MQHTTHCIIQYTGAHSCGVRVLQLCCPQLSAHCDMSCLNKLALMHACHVLLLHGGGTPHTVADTGAQKLSHACFVLLPPQISRMPKQNGSRARTVVITQGSAPTVVAVNGRVTLYPVIALPAEKLVDTNGAGALLPVGIGHQTSMLLPLPFACAPN